MSSSSTAAIGAGFRPGQRSSRTRTASIGPSPRSRGAETARRWAGRTSRRRASRQRARRPSRGLTR
eukprot:13514189-Alexandrium_andersonii.AAC.1